jgi:23S rRNA pseudoU1915 N3-methylase RlmH
MGSGCGSGGGGVAVIQNKGRRTTRIVKEDDAKDMSSDEASQVASFWSAARSSSLSVIIGEPKGDSESVVFRRQWQHPKKIRTNRSLSFVCC